MFPARFPICVLWFDIQKTFHSIFNCIKTAWNPERSRRDTRVNTKIIFWMSVLKVQFHWRAGNHKAGSNIGAFFHTIHNFSWRTSEIQNESATLWNSRTFKTYSSLLLRKVNTINNKILGYACHSNCQVGFIAS